MSFSIGVSLGWIEFFDNMEGAIHSTKISGNFGPKLNGRVQSNRKNFEKTGKPFEVDHFSRSDRLEFWLSGLHPESPSVLIWNLRDRD